MKNLFLFVTLFVTLLSSCKNDDGFYYDQEYVNEVLVDINSNISSLKELVKAKKDGKYVANVEVSENGYVILFDDETQIIINNGKATDDVLSPKIGIKESDGDFYWTITIDDFTQIIECNGLELKVEDKTPVMKVDDKGFWIIDIDNSIERIKDKDKNDVKITENVDLFICNVDITMSDVKFIFTDNSEVIFPKVIKEVPDDKPQAMVESKGFYIVNEDWMGHSKGSVNYFMKNGNSYEQKYRVFRAANPGKELGVTTCFGAIWGDNMYFVSKQENRLVVADANTMKSKKIITELGGDGRSFVGVDDKKAYIGYNGGIRPFSLSDFSLGNPIDGVSGQIGNSCISEGKVFAVSQRNLYIIDAESDKVLKDIPGSYNSVVTAKDGSVWVAASDKFVVYNPETLDSKDVAYPEGAKVSGSWGAWNPGGLCASTQTNTLYWTAGGSMFGGGNIVCKYDIDSSTANTSFYQIPNDEEGNKRVFYGAGLRVDPLSDNLVIQCYRDGFMENYAYNWVFMVDSQGNEVTNFVVENDTEEPVAGNGYYWFPSMPVFEDVNKPQILLNQVMLAPNDKVEIDLKDKIIDYDNTFASIIKKVELIGNTSEKATVSINDDKLIVMAQSTECNCKFKLIAVSNGVRVEKEIELVISN